MRAMGNSFISGADDSMLYDTLSELGISKKYNNKLNVLKVYDFIQLAFTLILVALIEAALKTNGNIVSPILDKFGLLITFISILMSTIFLIKGFGAYIASNFNKVDNEYKEIILGLILNVICLSVILFIKSEVLIIKSFAGVNGLLPFISSNFAQLHNDRIPNSKRTTILSLFSVVSESVDMAYLTILDCIG